MLKAEFEMEKEFANLKDNYLSAAKEIANFLA
jgi:hypothetical protein